MPLLDKIKTEIVNPVILLLFAVAFLIFFWGLVEYLKKGESASGDRKELYDKLIWGIVGLAIMASVFGIMQLIVDTVYKFSSSN